MVLYVQKYDIDPAKAADYIDWAKSAIPRILSVPGVVEFRGYRPAAGDSQIAVTYEFADMVSWAEWQASETIQQVLVEVGPRWCSLPWPLSAVLYHSPTFGTLLAHKHKKTRRHSYPLIF
jgi:heme-degrading monooxygenase HmoA